MLQRALIVSLAAAGVALAHSSHGSHGHHHRGHHGVFPRAASASASATSTATHSTTSSVSKSSAAAQTTSTTTSAPAAGATGSSSVSLSTGTAVTGSDALPLASIVAASVVSADPQGTTTLPTTTAGAKPSGLTNAPALPDISSWDPTKYPPLDKPPPTDSAEVLEWIQQVRDSGVVVPNITPHAYTIDGNNCQLADNLARVNNATECWWTCGHCVRKTDIVECAKSKTWGSSFDDGPSPDTARLLHYLEDNAISSTFFEVGSRVVSRPVYTQTQYLLGHQIGVHTWSHTALTSQTSEQIIAELGWTKKVIKEAIGVTPLLMRPPYGDIDDRVRAIVKAMNMTPAMWTVTGTEQSPVAFDTFDYQVPSGTVTATDSVSRFLTLLANADAYGKGFIVLQHDLWWEQVELSLGYFLPTAAAHGYKIETIGACMNTELADTYAETTTSTSLPVGSGQGDDITGTGTTAERNAPLGGSDGSNTDASVTSSGGADNGTSTDDGSAARVRADMGTSSLIAAVLLAAAFAFVPAAF